MSATKTLTLPTAGVSCNGQVNSNDPMQMTVLYSQNNSFLWQKRTLYLLLILLVSVVVINMTLIFWIIKILDLKSAGPGKLRLFEGGLQMESGTEFLDTLIPSQIHSPQSQPLIMESSRNVTFLVKDGRGFITNLLSLGDSGFQAIGNDFLVRSKSNDILFRANPKEVLVSADNFMVSGSGGLNLDGSLETPLVRGSATKDLKLESVLKRVKIRSEKDFSVDSPAGGILVTGLKNMNLRSTSGRVIVEGTKLKMNNLKTANLVTRNKYPGTVYQVCACDNGRLFLAHRQGYCQIQESFCRDPSPRGDIYGSYHRIS